MNTSEVREVLRRELYGWIVTEPPAPNAAKRESYEAADAALQALKDTGLDIQELQAKAAAFDQSRFIFYAQSCNSMNSPEGRQGRAIAVEEMDAVLEQERARLVPEEGEKKSK
jgi:hypothetical protein